MVEPGQGPRSGARDNGLRCAGYIAVGDLDPRVADELLESLRTEGIAAYVAPTPGAPTDRLYADSTQGARAHELLAAAPDPAFPAGEAGPDDETDNAIDFESEWRHLVGSLQAGDPTTSIPLSAASFATPPELDEHFVPPPPPPLPKLRRVTVAALLSILGGLILIVTNLDGGALIWLAILAILGGGAALVYHVKEGPPNDSGWDDGAVV